MLNENHGRSFELWYDDLFISVSICEAFRWRVALHTFPDCKTQLALEQLLKREVVK